MSRCDWNPGAGSWATTPPSDGDCQNEASFAVEDGAYLPHLCASCVRLPRFLGRHADPLPKTDFPESVRVSRRLPVVRRDDRGNDFELHALHVPGTRIFAVSRRLWDALQSLPILFDQPPQESAS